MSKCDGKGERAIPIITVIHDMVARVKGPYYRLVGRYTQRFLGRAVKKSANDIQKRVLFIAVAGMDDFFSTLFRVKGTANTFAKAAIEKKLTKRQLSRLFRLYLSTLLMLTGNYRDLLLTESGLNETAWMQLWCEVFEYSPEDSDQFNKLLPAYQGKSIDNLVSASAGLMTETLSTACCEMHSLEEAVLKDALMKDMSAILRVLNPVKGA